MTPKQLLVDASSELCERLTYAKTYQDYVTHTRERSSGTPLLSHLLWTEHRLRATASACIHLVLAVAVACEKTPAAANVLLPGVDDTDTATRKLLERLRDARGEDTVASLLSELETGKLPEVFPLVKAAALALQHAMPRERRVSDAWTFLVRGHASIPTLALKSSLDFLEKLKGSASSSDTDIASDSPEANGATVPGETSTLDDSFTGAAALAPTLVHSAQTRRGLYVLLALEPEDEHPLQPVEDTELVRRAKNAFSERVQPPLDALKKVENATDEPNSFVDFYWLASQSLDNFWPTKDPAAGDSALRINESESAWTASALSGFLKKQLESQLRAAASSQRLKGIERRLRTTVQALASSGVLDQLRTTLKNLHACLPSEEALWKLRESSRQSDPSGASSSSGRQSVQTVNNGRSGDGDDNGANQDTARQGVARLVRHPATDLAVIVDVHLSEEPLVAPAHGSTANLNVYAYALPLHAVFEVADEPEGSQWWRPYVAGRSVTYLRQLASISAVADDRMRLLTGREVLSGACAQCLLVRSARQEPLSYDIHHSELSHASGSTNSGHQAIAALAGYDTCFSVEDIKSMAGTVGVNSMALTAMATDAGVAHRQPPTPTSARFTGAGTAKANAPAYAVYRVLGMRVVSDSSTYQSKALLRGKDAGTLCADASVAMGILQLAAALKDPYYGGGDHYAQRRRQKYLADVKRNPLFADFMPTLLRLNCASGNVSPEQLALDVHYWEERLGIHHEGAEEHRLLLELLTERVAAVKPVLYLVPTNAYLRALETMQGGHGGLLPTFCRPVMLRYTLAYRNLANIRTRLLQLQEQRCFTLVFLALGEELPAAAVARLLQPFLDSKQSSLHLVLEFNGALVDSLRLSDIGQYLRVPHATRSGMEGALQPSVVSSYTPGGPQHALLAAANDLYQDAAYPGLLHEWASRDLTALCARNDRLRGWRAALQAWAATPQSQGPALLLLIQPDGDAASAMVSEFCEAQGEHGQWAKPFVFECASSMFYKRLDNDIRRLAQWKPLPSQSTTGRNATAGDEAEPLDTAEDGPLHPPPAVPVLIFKGANLLTLEEKAALVTRLRTAGTAPRAIFCASTFAMADVSLLGETRLDDVVLDFSRAAPLPPVSHMSEQATCVAQWILGSFFSVELQKVLSALLEEPQGELLAKDVAPHLGEDAPTEVVHAVVECFQAIAELVTDHRDVNTRGVLTWESQEGTAQSLPAALWQGLKNGDITETSPSFDQFALTAAVAQVCPQTDLLDLWLTDMAPTMCPPPAHLSNAHGMRLLEMLAHSASADGLSGVTRKTAQEDADRLQGGPPPVSAAFVSRCRVLQPSRLASDLLSAASRGEQLPWNDLAQPLSKHPPSARALVDMLCTCSQPLRFVAALGPQALHTTLQSASEADLMRLASLLSISASSKRTDRDATPLSGTIGTPHLELAAELAAAPAFADRKWAQSVTASLAVLFFNVVHQRRHSERDTAAASEGSPLALCDTHVQAMLRSGLYFRLNAGSSTSLLPLLLRLDEPSRLFLDQPDVKRWVSAGCSVSALENVFSLADVWGRAIVEAMLHPTLCNTTEKTVLTQTWLAQAAYAVLAGHDLPLRRSTRAVAGLSPLAVGLLLERAPEEGIASLAALSHAHMPRAAEAGNVHDAKHIAACIRRNGRVLEPVANAFRFLKEWNKLLVKDNKRLPAFAGLAVASEHDRSGQLPPRGADALLEVLWTLACEDDTAGAAVQDHSELGKLVRRWSLAKADDAGDAAAAADKVNAEPSPAPPLERDELRPMRLSLLRLWQETLQDCVGPSPCLSADQVWRALQGDLKRLSPAIYAALLRDACTLPCEEDGILAHQAVVVVLWALYPSTDLPLQPESKPKETHLRPESWRLLRQLAEKPLSAAADTNQPPTLDMHAWVEAHSTCSLLALFLTHPQHLPLCQLQSFKRRFNPGSDEPLESASFLFAQRSGDRGFFLTSFNQKTDGRSLFSDLEQAAESLCAADDLKLEDMPDKMTFVVDRGCNLDIMKMNLTVYMSLTHPDFEPKGSEAHEFRPQTFANARYVLNLLLLWFAGLRISRAELDALANRISKKLHGVERIVKESNSRQSEFVEQPLKVKAPCVMDTYLHRRRGLQQLCGPTTADGIATLQAFNAFLPVAERFSMEPQDVERAHRPSMADATKRLAKHLVHKGRDVVGIEHEPIELRDLVTVCAAMLCRFAAEGLEARQQALAAVDSFFRELASGERLIQAWAFRWLVRGIGFTSVTGSLDRDMPDRADETPKTLLLEAFKKAMAHSIAMCDATRLEVLYFYPKETEAYKDVAVDEMKGLGSGQAQFPVLDLLAGDGAYAQSREWASALQTDHEGPSPRRRSDGGVAGDRASAAAHGNLPLEVARLDWLVAGDAAGGADGHSRHYGGEQEGQCHAGGSGVGQRSSAVDGSATNGNGNSGGSQLGLHAEGFVSFRWADDMQQVVVRAAGLVRLQRVTTPEVKLDVDAVEHIPGPGGALVLRTEDTDSPWEQSANYAFLDKRDLIMPELLRDCKVVAVFPSHAHALSFLRRSLPANAILVGDGMLLKMSARGGRLVPLFLTTPKIDASLGPDAAVGVWSDGDTGNQLMAPLASAQEKPCPLTLPEALAMGPMLNLYGLQAGFFKGLTLLVALAIARLRPASTEEKSSAPPSDVDMDGWEDVDAAHSDRSYHESDSDREEEEEEEFADDNGNQHDHVHGEGEDPDDEDFIGQFNLFDDENGHGAADMRHDDDQSEPGEESDDEFDATAGRNDAMAVQNRDLSHWIDEQLEWVASHRWNLETIDADDQEARYAALNAINLTCSKLNLGIAVKGAVDKMLEGEDDAFEHWLAAVPDDLRKMAQDHLIDYVQGVMQNQTRYKLLEEFLAVGGANCPMPLQPWYFLSLHRVVVGAEPEAMGSHAPERSYTSSCLRSGVPPGTRFCHPTLRGKDLATVTVPLLPAATELKGSPFSSAGGSTEDAPFLPVGDGSAPFVICPPRACQARYLSAQDGGDGDSCEGHLLHIATIAGQQSTGGVLILQPQQEAWLVQCIRAPLPRAVAGWCLGLALGWETQLSLAPQSNPDRQLTQAIVAFALADTCPFPEARPHLVAAFGLPEPLPRYFTHVANTYGMFVCSKEELLRLQLEFKAPMRDVDVLELQTRGVVAVDQVFAHLMQQFSHTTLVVYVRNCIRAHDQLLKWCAEHTKAVPFHFFFFEEVDLSRNFSEIRDRFSKTLFFPASLAEVNYASQSSNGGNGDGGGDNGGSGDSGSGGQLSLYRDGPDDDESDGEDDIYSGHSASQSGGAQGADAGGTVTIEETHYAGHELDSGSAGTTDLLPLLKKLGAVGVHPGTQELTFQVVQRKGQGLHTEFSGNWKAAVRKWMAPATSSAPKLSVFVLISPPGAGKTVFMEKHVLPQWRKPTGVFSSMPIYFDASSSQLVEEALLALLERLCGTRPQPLSLVVDEYHMLTEPQKKQLFQFLQMRSKQKPVRAILVGNRHEKHDRDIVEKWKVDCGEENIVMRICRLPVVHVRALARKQLGAEEQNETAVERLHWWYAAARFLFSDDVLTFRNVSDVLKALRSSPSHESLGRVLNNKMEALGELMCTEFSAAVLELFRRLHRKGMDAEARLALDPSSDMPSKEHLQELYDAKDEHPLMMLARTALLAAFVLRCESPMLTEDWVGGRNTSNFLDGEMPPAEGEEVGIVRAAEPDESTLMSFPEFVARLTMASRLHPVVRLSAWVHYVHQKAGQALGLQLTEPPRTQCLRRLRLIDQPGFPLVTAIAVQPAPLARCRGFSEDGDYTDLHWIRVSLQHNAAISWRRARSVWHTNFVSDVDGLNRLLEECPDRHSCLSALSPVNLTSLLTMVQGTQQGNTLATVILENLNDAEHCARTTDASNPFLLALWYGYLRGLTDADLDAAEKPYVEAAEKILETHAQLAMLLWAARFAADLPPTKGVGPSTLVHLRRDLVQATSDLVEKSRVGVLPVADGAADLHDADTDTGALPSAALVNNEGDSTSQLLTLYGGAFAKLAPDPAHPALNPDAGAAAFLLASAAFPGNDYWPEALRDLVQLLNHGRLSAEELERIAEWSLFSVVEADQNETVEPDAATTVQLPPLVAVQQRLVSRLLQPDRVQRLPTCWQVALLTQVKEPWCDEPQARKLLEDAEFVRLHFEEGLHCLQKAKDIWPEWPPALRLVLTNAFKNLHGTENREDKKDAQELLNTQAKKEQKAKLKKDMELFTSVLGVQDDAILRFFNHRIGSASLREARAQKAQLDKYKNPVGDSFDFARKNAFIGVQVLVGDFSPELPFTLFEFHSPAAFRRAKEVLLGTGGSHMRVAREGSSLWIRKDHVDHVKHALGEQGSARRTTGPDYTTGRTEYKREHDLAVLRKNVEDKLGDKGFKTDFVTNADDFVKSLGRGKYHVAWILSGSLANALRQHSGNEEALLRSTQELVKACLAFHANGGGLFIFAENDPYHWHANALLEAFDRMQVQGDVAGDNYVFADESEQVGADIQRKRSVGKLCDSAHPITTGLQTLFEGVTVSVPRGKRPGWRALVTGGYPAAGAKRPAVDIVLQYRQDDCLGRQRQVNSCRPGRVLLDTAYTKLWLNWTEAGTDRYVANATAYLTGLDVAIRVLGEKGEPVGRRSAAQLLRDGARPLPQPVCSPWEGVQGQQKLAAYLYEQLPPALDVVMVVDMSGSMSSFFSQAKEYVKKAVQLFEIGSSRNRMALVAFGSSSRLMAPLGSTRHELERAADSMNCLGGTQFGPPLRDTATEFQTRGSRNRKLVLFQTDGGNSDRGIANTAASHLINSVRAEVVAVVVSQDRGVEESALQITGKPGRYADSPAQKRSDGLVVQLSDYNKLVEQVEAIVERVKASA